MPSPPPAPEESTPVALAASATATAGVSNRPPFAGEEDDCSDSESEDETEDDEVIPPADRAMPSATASASKIQAAVVAAAASEGRRPVAAALDDSRRLFQRLFTDEDEMAILEGFYQFTSSRGTTHHPHQHDTGPFYDQIRARLQLDFSKNQLVEKLRRLKKKYRTAAAKIDSGRNFSFKSPHDKAAYEVSRKIWSTAVPPRGSGGDHDDIEEQNDHDLDNGDRIRKRGRKRAAESAARVSETVPVEVKAVQSFTAIELPNAAAPPPTPAPTPEPPAAAAADPSPLEVPVSVVEETVRSCVAPLFRDLLSCTINGPWMSGNPNGMMPASFGGSSEAKGSSGLEEKWRQQQILELQVFSKRLELVQEKIKKELEELRGRGR